MHLTTEPAACRRALAAFLHHTVGDDRWHDVAIVVRGSAAAGNADTYSDVDIELIAPTERHDALVAAATAAGQFTPGQRPVIYRSAENTADGRRALCAAELRRLDDLERALRDDTLIELWVMQRAWLIRDPDHSVAGLVTEATATFNHNLETHAAAELGHAARRQRWLAIAAQRPDPTSAALLTAQPPDIDHTSAAILATAQTAARQRWPTATWPGYPPPLRPDEMLSN